MKHYIHTGLLSGYSLGYILATNITFRANRKCLDTGKSPIREVDAEYAEIHQLVVL